MESDRRESKRLRDDQAGQSVEPAGGLDTEKVGEEDGDRARQSEQQDKSKTDHEGWGDDRQNGQGTQKALIAETRPRDDECESKPECRGDGAHHDG